MAASKSVSHEVHTKIDWRYALMVYRNGFKGKHGDNFCKFSQRKEKKRKEFPYQSCVQPDQVQQGFHKTFTEYHQTQQGR